ncbi:EF-hand domain-containing protein [Spirillospora sp. CA-253888]
MNSSSVSDLRRSKFERWFTVLDIDGDEALARHDFEQFGRSYAEALGLSPTSPESQAMVNRSLELWDLLERAAEDGSLTRGQFLDLLQSLSADEASLIVDQVRRIGQAWFDACDTDESGRLDHQKHGQMLQNTLAISDAEADEAFRRLDRAGTGTISKSEFVDAFGEFVTSDDPEAPGNWFFGPF